MSTQQQIESILDRRFVFTESMAQILTLALEGQKNAIIFGPAGHGKSQMVQAVVDGLKLDAFTQFFGEGMDEARLFGGLNFKRFNEEHILEYQTDRSFLVHEVAIFEEVFDAPASVLLALKDTLTSGVLRNGPQQVPSKCKTVICLTNRAPKDISELGPAAHALIERFPLHLSLEWPKYDDCAYYEMFNKVAGNHAVNQVLATIISHEDAGFVSPRTAMHALQVIKTAAAIRGSNRIDNADLAQLKYVPGLEQMATSLKAKLKDAQAEDSAKKALDNVNEKVNAVRFSELNTPIKALKLAKEMQRIADTLSELRVPDSLVTARDSWREKVVKIIMDAQAKALELTRL